jgi:RNA polymerase sigma-70 factor (ECF subfamily)
MSDSSEARFLTLLEAHHKIVLKVASVYCWDAEERNDLIQEITMQLWRAFPSYDARRVFSTWMYRVALNVAISFARKTGRRRRIMAPLEDAGVDLPADARGPEPDERLEALHRCMRGLDPFSRALLTLYLDDRSHREIAEVLGISETNVATKIGRLKQRLRSDLAPASR